MSVAVISDVHVGTLDDMKSLLDKVKDCDTLISIGDIAGLEFEEKKGYYAMRAEYQKALKAGKLDSLDEETKRIGSLETASTVFHALSKERQQEILDQTKKDFYDKLAVLKKHNVAVIFGNWEDAMRRDHPQFETDKALSEMESYPEPAVKETEDALFVLIPALQSSAGQRELTGVQEIREKMLAARKVGKEVIVVSHKPFHWSRFKAFTGFDMAPYDKREIRQVDAFIRALGMENIDRLVHGHLHLSYEDGGGKNDYKFKHRDGKFKVHYLPEREAIVFKKGKKPKRVSVRV